MKKLTLLALLTYLLAACSKEKPQDPPIPPATDYSRKADFKKMEWIMGAWEAEYPNDERFHEAWVKMNDTLFTGKGAFLKGNDTTFKENLAILVKDTAIYYRVNNKVYFRLVSNKEGDHVFENLQHDYPQRILYKHTSEDVLHARIEGEVNGQVEHEDFILTKLK